MKSKFWFFLALLMGGCLLVSGCLSVSPTGWSGPVVDDDALYVSTVGGRVIRYVLLSDPEPLAVRKGHFDLPAGGGGGSFSCAPMSVAAGIYGTPFVADGVVYIGGYNGKVYAIGAVNMTEIWSYPAEGYIGAIVGSPVVADGILYIGSADGKLYAIDIATRELAWDAPFATNDDIWSTPVVHDGTVYFGSLDHKLYAVDAMNGTQVWESPFQTDGAITATPLVINETIYFGSFDRRFYAVNANTGQVKDGFTPFSVGNWFWGKAVAHEDMIIVGCLDGRVYALDAQTGECKWYFPEEGQVGPIRGDPALVGELVIFGSENGKVYALNASNGVERWEYPPDEEDYIGTIRASLYAGDGVVYVQTTSQEIYALETGSGDKLWGPLSILSE